MTHKQLNRIIALFAFLVPMVVYALTIAPTVVFWDVGEFIAAAYMLQVPHPPGSPLFLLLTRIVMMIPFASDLAVRAHALSAVLSSLAIMFLYLVIVRVIIKMRGMPETLADKLAVYGSAFIGAMSLAFGTTYWDNAIEAEVYGASMFFLTVIMWLAMRWLERADTEGGERYVLLIAYLIGLSLGVHLLALLSIFPVLMIIYFKRYEFSLNSFVKFGLVAVAVFFVVYPGIVKWMPGMMDGEFGKTKAEIFKYIPWAILAAALYGVYYSYIHKKRMLHIALLSGVMIFFGYSTYTSVIIRANQNPPMNENDPSNLARLTSYLGREQYGDAPILQRRYSQEPQHQGIYTNYTSDLDFLIRYQLNHMFFRYVGWNYIGQAGDEQDSGVTAKDTLGIPFLVGLFGLWWQFKKDWKMGLVFVVMFIVLGPILALYQNQQEPQPRERDYFYVGAFYVFSLWIAIGIVGIIDLLRRWRPSMTLPLSAASVLVFAAAIPANMIRINYHEHDRSGNYVAWDYSYNMLQTCEPDAILFTNGDNDTFPLWYLQDVEGIRRDVRVVNLSLINTSWYIKQMKQKPYYAEARPVPISLTDREIETIGPIQFQERRLSLPVPREVYARYGVTDTAEINKGKIEFTMRPTLQFGNISAIRVQDILVQDIIFTNKWQRPIYFAVTCSPDSKIGLDEYLWFNGLAWRLEPRKIPNREDGGINVEILEANLYNEPEGFYKTPHYGYKFRNINNPDVYFDENTTRLMVNYRSAFIRLALHYANVVGNRDKAAAILDRMEYLIPRSKIPMGWELASDIGAFYLRMGRKDKYDELMAEVEPECWRVLESGQYNLASYYNPVRVLLDLYEIRKDYQKSLDVLRWLEQRYPNEPTIQQRIAQLQAQLATQNPAPHKDTIPK